MNLFMVPIKLVHKSLVGVNLVTSGGVGKPGPGRDGQVGYAYASAIWFCCWTNCKHEMYCKH